MSAGLVRYVQDHIVMQPDGFGRPPAGDPAISNIAGGIPEEELIGALQGCDDGRALKQPGRRWQHGAGIGAKSVERHHEYGMGIHNVGRV